MVWPHTESFLAVLCSSCFPSISTSRIALVFLSLCPVPPSCSYNLPLFIYYLPVSSGFPSASCRCSPLAPLTVWVSPKSLTLLTPYARQLRQSAACHSPTPPRSSVESESCRCAFFAITRWGRWKFHSAQYFWSSPPRFECDRNGEYSWVFLEVRWRFITFSSDTATHSDLSKDYLG